MKPHRTAAFDASSRALDQAIDAAISGAPTHASGTTFVPADLADSRLVESYRRSGPVAIIDAKGGERRLSRRRSLDMLWVVGVGAAVVTVARKLLGRVPA